MEPEPWGVGRSAVGRAGLAPQCPSGGQAEWQQPQLAWTTGGCMSLATAVLRSQGEGEVGWRPCQVRIGGSKPSCLPAPQRAAQLAQGLGKEGGVSPDW